MNKNTLYTYMHNCEKVRQSFLLKKIKKLILKEGASLSISFFVAILRKCSGKPEKMVIFISKLLVAIQRLRCNVATKQQ